MKLFSKLKDYNSKLEEILDKKYFSSNIKNLLLSMIYKIEISYKDYKQVKRVVRTEEEFLDEILQTIQKYCDNIKTVEPEKSQANLLAKNNTKALTNERERSILAYPTEVSLLYAISDIGPKYFYMKDSFIFKKAFQNILVDGYNLNNLEILNNFNGWSWDSNQKEDINNIIYQNLLFILGEKFLFDWRNYSSVKRDFIYEIKSYIRTFTGNNSFFISLCKTMYLIANEEDKKNIEDNLKMNSKELKKILNKEKYFEEITLEKIKLMKLVEKIDLNLNDEKILIKEFNKRNSKVDEDKKISNIKVFIGMLEREKESYIGKINDISSLLKPSNFLKRKQELEELEEILKNRNTAEQEIINLQKEFLKILEKKLKKINTRDEIIDIIYELRYYKNINIHENKDIKMIEEISELVDIIMKKAVTKACKLGIIKIISMNITLNYEIINYALDTKIINLEDIKLYLEIEENVLTIKVYDKEIFEKQGKKELENAKKEIEVKQKRMIKLFN